MMERLGIIFIERNSWTARGPRCRVKSTRLAARDHAAVAGNVVLKVFAALGVCALAIYLAGP
jgi:hypothetical protein